jgi:uncharacterized membrane protein HdeD (DUF308 family)
MACTPPAEPAFFFLALITAWTSLRGIFELSAALKMHQSRRSPHWLALSAAISILFSLISIAIYPEDAMNMHWLLTVYTASIGSIWLALAYAMRSQDILEAIPLLPFNLRIRI